MSEDARRRAEEIVRPHCTGADDHDSENCAKCEEMIEQVADAVAQAVKEEKAVLAQARAFVEGCIRGHQEGCGCGPGEMCEYFGIQTIKEIDFRLTPWEIRFHWMHIFWLESRFWMLDLATEGMTPEFGFFDAHSASMNVIAVGWTPRIGRPGVGTPDAELNRDWPGEPSLGFSW
jgi:hypothetical protein